MFRKLLEIGFEVEKQKENEKNNEDVVKERVRDLCNAVISIGGKHTTNSYTPSSRLQIMRNDIYILKCRAKDFQRVKAAKTHTHTWREKEIKELITINIGCRWLWCRLNRHHSEYTRILISL